MPSAKRCCISMLAKQAQVEGEGLHMGIRRREGGVGVEKHTYAVGSSADLRHVKALDVV